ncbi:MAG TPA: hydroxyisourate hydrolase [Phycisphaerae bacterium]|nr:hydroxyisourate hydrolase [Phycisphaerae bacterium]
MGALTTHVLDTAAGRPAAGVRIDLFRIDQQPVLLKSVMTTADGRTDEPLLAADAFLPGTYQLLFYVADYHAARNHPDAGKFLTHVPIVFRVADASAKYHVPLLVTPWGYTTYRGS